MKRSLKAIADMQKEAGRGNERTDNNASAEDLIARYSKKSENELMGELMNAVAKQKAEGSFDPSALQNGVNAILPMLNEEQKRKLFEITGRL